MSQHSVEIVIYDGQWKRTANKLQPKYKLPRCIVKVDGIDIDVDFYYEIYKVGLAKFIMRTNRKDLTKHPDYKQIRRQILIALEKKLADYSQYFGTIAKDAVLR